ncbi:MAG: hypothetical protein J0H55_09525 [Chitinophagaceae bacterium]|nr:hypothetical protein [Chitinophagaceae bacterium]
MWKIYVFFILATEILPAPVNSQALFFNQSPIFRNLDSRVVGRSRVTIQKLNNIQSNRVMDMNSNREKSNGDLSHSTLPVRPSDVKILKLDNMPCIVSTISDNMPVRKDFPDVYKYAMPNRITISNESPFRENILGSDSLK